MNKNKALRELAVWVTYPVVMIIAFVSYYEMIEKGFDCSVASYVTATMGGVFIITMLEKILPYRAEWAPNKAEVRTDVTFMLLMEILLPKLLSIITVMWVFKFLQGNEWIILAWWPHQLLIWVQMLLIFFLVSFPRYWLHRTAHEWIPLWKFHAVHHSVKKLNWINVGRFHPVDKSLQFVCDTIPFILLGVSREVLALYFVAYSIKGFFQHSNVDVKLGWFNYIISGPELHRWHHSKIIKEANTNYGNDIILWDILFGTFFLPKEGAVGELGLFDRNYPTAFLDLLKAPFKSTKKTIEKPMDVHR